MIRQASHPPRRGCLRETCGAGFGQAGIGQMAETGSPAQAACGWTLGASGWDRDTDEKGGELRQRARHGASRALFELRCSAPCQCRATPPAPAQNRAPATRRADCGSAARISFPRLETPRDRLGIGTAPTAAPGKRFSSRSRFRSGCGARGEASQVKGSREDMRVRWVSRPAKGAQQACDGAPVDHAGQSKTRRSASLPPAEEFVRELIQERKVTSSLLPTYARVHLSFERGEGAWLVATNGERYLDFGAGIAVNSLGHAPSARARGADRAGAASSGTPRTYIRDPAGRALAKRLAETTFADYAFFTNSGAEAVEVRDQDGAQISFGERPARALPHHHLRGRLSWPHAGDHRGRRQCEISRRLRPQGRWFRPGAVRRPRGA